MDVNAHCQCLVQFMWWGAQASTVSEDYRVAITLLTDPKPSILVWKNRTITKYIGPAPDPTAMKPMTTTPTNAHHTALINVLGTLKTTMDSVILKDPDKTSDGNKHFARLPDHLKTLLFHLGHVPGTPEPGTPELTALCADGVSFMLQHTLVSSTSLLKTVLRKKSGLSVMVQSASVQALRTGQLIWDDLSVPGNHSIFQYYSPMRRAPTHHPGHLGPGVHLLLCRRQGHQQNRGIPPQLQCPAATPVSPEHQ